MAERKEFTKSDMEANRRDAYADGRIAGWEAGKKQAESKPLFNSSYDDGYKFGHKMGKIDGIGQTIVGLIVVVGVIFIGFISWEGMEKAERERTMKEHAEKAERLQRAARQCAKRWEGYPTSYIPEQDICTVRIWPDSHTYVPEDRIHVGGEPPWKK